MEHLFWLILLVTVIIWYVIVTAIVAVRGWKDIQSLLDQASTKELDGVD